MTKQALLELLHQVQRGQCTAEEAALQLNRVFEAADKAAQQYLENVRLMSEKGSGEL